MKQPATPELMQSLAPGDTVHFRDGGSLVLTKESLQKTTNPYFIWEIKNYDCFLAYNSRGNILSDAKHPLDIVAITKAVQIPPGFTRWEGGECPVGPFTKVEVIYGGGQTELCIAKNRVWGHEGFRRKDYNIIAYRVIPPKASGEIWCVVPAMGLPTLLSSEQQAINYCKQYSSLTKVSAIFPLFAYEGKWAEGMGLELLEEKSK